MLNSKHERKAMDSTKPTKIEKKEDSENKNQTEKVVNKKFRKTPRTIAQEKFVEIDPVSFSNNDYWDRKKMIGYSTIPRVLPITMQILDVLTKGKPVGHTYFCLWARLPDFSFMKIDNPELFAKEAGFTGQRAQDTWKGRMLKLVEYGFIKNYEGHTGPFHYILMRNPVKVMKELNEKGEFNQGTLKTLYERFKERAEQVGANDN